MVNPLLLRFIPAAVRAVAPRLGRGIGSVRQGFRKIQEAPFVGTQTQKPFDPATTGFGALDDSLTTGAKGRGAALRLGLGAIEGAAAVDSFTDPESTLFDKAIGATYGLGAFQFGRRGLQMARAARRGTAVPEATEFGKRIELAQVPAFAGDVLLGGPREIDIGQPPEVEESNQLIAALQQEGGLNDKQLKVMREFTRQFPDGKGASQETINRLKQYMAAAADPVDKQVQTKTTQKEQIYEDPPLSKKIQKELNQTSAEAKEEDPRPTIDPESNDGPSLEKTLTETNKAAQKTIIKPRYSNVNFGDAGELFEKLRIKKTDYAASDAAIKDYQEKIVANASKIKSFEEYKKQYDNMVGDGDETLKNVTMLKWGLSLMQGTSNQGGLAGALDAVSKASLPFANDLQAIAASEKQENQMLAQQYMEYEKAAQENLNRAELTALELSIQQAQRLENANTSLDTQFINFQLELMKHNAEQERLSQEALNKAGNLSGKTQLRQFTDEAGIGGVTNKLYHLGKDDGRPKVIMNGQVIDVLSNPELAAEYERGNDITEDRDKKGIRTSRGNLASINEGIRYADIVLGLYKKKDEDPDSPTVLPGFQASLARLVTNFDSFTKDVSQTLFRTSGNDTVAGRQYDAVNPNTDVNIMKAIQSNLTMEPVNPTRFADAEDYKRENLKVQKMFNDDMREAQDIAAQLRDKTNKNRNKIIARYVDFTGQDQYNLDETAEQIAQLLVIEQRMKYILANANKGEDRLTVADVEDAGKRTQLFKFLAGSKEIYNTYKVLRQDLISKSRTAVQNYKAYGGSDSSINHLVYIPEVQKAGNVQLAQTLGQAAQQTPATTNKEDITNTLLNNFYGILEDRAEE